MNHSHLNLSPWRLAFRESRLVIFFEFALIAAVFVADHYGFIYFSKTPYLLALGWLSLAIRGVSWKDVGFLVSHNWRRLVVLGIAAGFAGEALELFVTQPLVVRLTGHYPDLSDFSELIGNWQLLLILIALSWVVAGFGEEFVWRGYVLNRAADLFGQTRKGWIASLLIVGVVFGCAHSYQGITGVVENTIAALFLGGVYLISGRNLIAPILAHAIGDTIDFLIIYSGHYPGM